MADLASVQVIVYGHVQGVFFRAFVSTRATQLGLTGYVRNLSGGTVGVNAEGERKQLDQLISYLKVGPPPAKVEKVATNWSEYSGNYAGFKVRY
ncbi:MAG: acylphosphatase [Dehalococcoidales bacterium]|jgi:acylphosphatase|nr:acylphosphatase [Dehalococcoidales bacterium]